MGNSPRRVFRQVFGGPASARGVFWRRAAGPGAASARRGRYRTLRFERLEDKALLSVVPWDEPASPGESEASSADLANNAPAAETGAVPAVAGAALLDSSDVASAAGSLDLGVAPAPPPADLPTGSAGDSGPQESVVGAPAGPVSNAAVDSALAVWDFVTINTPPAETPPETISPPIEPSSAPATDWETAAIHTAPLVHVQIERASLADPYESHASIAADFTAQIEEAQAEMLAEAEAWRDYWSDTCSQIVYGDFGDDVTGAGTTDPLGRVIAEHERSPSGQTATVTQFAYDAAGRRTALTDPMNNTTQWAYDPLDRVVAETDPLGGVRSFEYDALGNLLRRTDRNGRAIGYVYDGLDRRVAERWYASAVDAAADANRVRELTWTYDHQQRLALASDPSAHYSFSYDGLDRLVGVWSVAGGLGVGLQQSHEELGRRTARWMLGGPSYEQLLANRFEYDAAGQLTRLTQADDPYVGAPAGQPLTPLRVDLAYNPIGQLARIDRFLELGLTVPVASTTYAYDPLGRLERLDHRRPGTPGVEGPGPLITGTTWQFDAAGRITRVDSNRDGRTDYVYDAVGQLVEARRQRGAEQPTIETFAYDAAGNRTSTARSGPSPTGPQSTTQTVVTGLGNRLASDGRYSYAYDAEGNRTARTEQATGHRTEYV